ncbi:hypothetical protein AT728_07440 [Streptomyces silvensis]|uniref:SprT-like domain-containing protein n=1 Tax=Streptomyces silvensis TaxID=1765722 RepID=A0A0W7X7Z2_9ACTN|nr:hypothetical protein AT728_07440 [Streptomyces silvensis]
MLHEAAHILCWQRGISETTMRGVYHNQSFLAAAEEVGLEWPPGRARIQGRGYDSPRMCKLTEKRHAADIAALEDAIPIVRPHLHLPSQPSSSTRPDRQTLQCECTPPRKMRMSPTVAQKAPVLCGACKAEFRPTP